MRIDPKYFSLFLLIVAIVTTAVIFYGTISYRQEQLSDFSTNVAEYDSLSLVKFRYVLSEDSISIGEYEGQPAVLLFRSSWSGKSLQMQYEIEDYPGSDSLIIFAASVKDALEEVRKTAQENENPNLIYVDGTKVYNRLQTPGIPSYIVIDKQGNLLFSHVGYQEGEVRDSLQKYLGND